MLDHVFLDGIAALRGALVGALLERQTFEERFRLDMLLGDLSWETSYALPGSTVPEVRADVTLDWPTWSQTAYRSWMLGEGSGEPPMIGVELAFRVDHLDVEPDLRMVLQAAAPRSPPIGCHWLERKPPVVAYSYTDALAIAERSVEICYEGTYAVPRPALEKVPVIDEHFAAMGSWVASTLVRLTDLNPQTS